MLKRLLKTRTVLLWATHFAVFCLAYLVAFQLRFDFALPAEMQSLLWRTLPWVVGTKLIVFACLRGFRGWWRYVTFADLVSVLRSCTSGAIAIAAVDYFLPGDAIPRSVLVLDWGISIVALGGLRSAWRLGRETIWAALRNGRRPTLVIGADCGGEALSRQIQNRSDLGYRIVGFLDDNQSRHGSCLGGIPFLGGLKDVLPTAKRHNVEDVLVISNSVTGRRLRDLIDCCQSGQIRVRMIPALDELLHDSRRLQLRDVEISDLLRREPVQLDSSAIREMIKGRRVLISGAGGSIGSEICRLVARENPSKLILLERAENNLFAIEQELRREACGVACVACVADICDEERLATVFSQHRPQIVFHAAAHKHVPLMEHNPGEAVKNNLFGTKKLADLSGRFGVDRFVLISTDKAVKPTSVMGMTKDLAERYVISLPADIATKYVVVRFGNVLGSAGSVVPIFREQIRRGGPITLTHPEMRRFFMTIPEASQLVLQAATLGEGGEVFLLDMGEPVSIADLAKDMIRLSGLSPDEIEIKVVGPRPGEKLSEEVIRAEEHTLPTTHPKLRVALREPLNSSDTQLWLSELAPLVDAPARVIREHLRALYPQIGESEDAKLPATAVCQPGNGHGHGNGDGIGTAIGNGHAAGNGNGSANGNGSGIGNGNGNGHVPGNGNVHVSPNVSGHGDGNGNDNGNGDGNGNGKTELNDDTQRIHGDPSSVNLRPR